MDVYSSTCQTGENVKTESVLCSDCDGLGAFVAIADLVGAILGLVRIERCGLCEGRGVVQLSPVTLEVNQERVVLPGEGPSC